MKESKKKLMNLYVDDLNKAELLAAIEEKIRKKSPSYVAFVNVDVTVKAEQDQKLRAIINEADFTMVDGMPLIWIANFHKQKLKEKVSGSDFVPYICGEGRKKRWRFYLLGGAEGVPEEAAENLLKKYPGLQIAGTYSPPFGFEKDREELENIKQKIWEAAPDVLVVSFGCPKQERFIYDHYREYGASVSICAGATMDFLAGRVKRCPGWISRIGMEWFYRFLMEPKRLFKRYFVDDMKIFRIACQYRPGRRNKKESDI